MTRSKETRIFNEGNLDPEELQFTDEWLNVRDLEIDHTIQRDKLDMRKVERIYKFYNPGALGVITVSKRNPVTLVVLDGMHRVEVIRRRTDNAGQILARVFTGLTRAQEAGIFLDLNYGNQPPLLTKFRVGIVRGDPLDTEIDRIIHEYGWVVAPNTAQGSIQAVGALRKVHARSVKEEADPPYLQLVIMCITRAWGLEYAGTHASILEGLGAIMAVYRDNLDLDLLQRVMAAYPGGPLGLHSDARQLAQLKSGRVSMAVGEQLVDAYNKRARSVKKSLGPWRQK